MTPPPGPLTPEFVAYDAGPALLGGITTLSVLAIISVVLRFWMRVHRRIGLKLDDWLIGVSMMPYLGLIACSYCSVFLAGIGKPYHVNVVEDPTRFGRLFKILYASLITTVINITLVKMSILAMYHRIFPTRFMKYSFIILGSIILLWGISTLLAYIFQCTPVHRAWDPTINGKCLNSFALYLGTGGIPNLLTDLVLLCLPMWEVNKLQVTSAQKIAIAANFLLGVSVIFADAFKLVVLVEIYLMFETSHDELAVLASNKFERFIMWVATEHALSIICANIPSLRPLLIMFLRWINLSKYPKNKNKNHTNDPRILIGRPVPKEGLITIGGSGADSASAASNPGKDRHRGRNQTDRDWPSFTQETLVGVEDTSSQLTPITIPSRSPSSKTARCATRNNSLSSGGVINNKTTQIHGDTDSTNSKINSPVSVWPAMSEYRVTITSDGQPPPSVARSDSFRTIISTDRDRDREQSQGQGQGGSRRTRSLRGFHVNTPTNSRPNTGYGSRGSHGVPIPEIPAIAVTIDTEVAWDDELQRVLLAHSDGIGVGL